jgi:hypothetical protein
VITAGWRQDEADDRALLRDIGPKALSVPLYAWFEGFLQEVPELAEAYRGRQRALKELKRIYRVRLGPALAVVRDLLESRLGHPELVDAEVEDAIRAVRDLDRRYLERSGTLQREFRETWEPGTHPVVRSYRERCAERLNGVRAVIVAGGHVGVLRNRLFFFGVEQALHRAHRSGATIVCWSAGAMALTERVVLFHDDPPHAQREAEVFDRGLSLLPGVVLLPHVRARLRLDDVARMSVFASRFEPALCLGLEPGAWLTWEDGTWSSRGSKGSVLRLDPCGQPVPQEGALAIPA